MVCNIRVVNKITNHDYDYSNIKSHDDDNNSTIKNDDTRYLGMIAHITLQF